MANLYFRDWNQEEWTMRENIDMYYLCYDKHWDYQEPMISSNMKDKTWKNIYENDIVEFEDWNICLVEYDGNRFHIKWYTMSEMCYEKCKIICHKYDPIDRIKWVDLTK